MGDSFIIENIELLYGHLYQVDFYDEKNDAHHRLFIEKLQIEKAKIVADVLAYIDNLPEENIMKQLSVEEVISMVSR